MKIRLSFLVPLTFVLGASFAMAQSNNGQSKSPAEGKDQKKCCMVNAQNTADHCKEAGKNCCNTADKASMKKMETKDCCQTGKDAKSCPTTNDKGKSPEPEKSGNDKK